MYDVRWGFGVPPGHTGRDVAGDVAAGEAGEVAAWGLGGDAPGGWEHRLPGGDAEGPRRGLREWPRVFAGQSRVPTRPVVGS